MKLKSTSFFNNIDMPIKYCSKEIHAGQNVSPQFSWEDFPSGAQSFALIMVDKSPKASNKVHWLVVDIPESIRAIPEGASTSSKMPGQCVELMNGFGGLGYEGPKPDKGAGKHNYVTTVYALDISSVGLRGAVSENDLLKKIKSHVLSQATITGLVGRH